jgi:hypothetical protein
VLSRQEGHFAKFWMMLRLFKYELEYGTIGAMYMASKLLQNDPEDQALKWHAGCGEKCAIHYDIYCYCVHVGKRGTLYNAKSTVVESVLGVPREVSRLDILAAVNGEPCPEHGTRTCYCAVTKDEETGEMKATDIRPKVVGVRWHFESTHSL